MLLSRPKNHKQNFLIRSHTLIYVQRIEIPGPPALAFDMSNISQFIIAIQLGIILHNGGTSIRYSLIVHKISISGHTKAG